MFLQSFSLRPNIKMVKVIPLPCQAVVGGFYF